jgi:hypothetical protein
MAKKPLFRNVIYPAVQCFSPDAGSEELCRPSVDNARETRQPI